MVGKDSKSQLLAIDEAKIDLCVDDCKNSAVLEAASGIRYLPKREHSRVRCFV
jgi:hypothetical protein